MSIEVIDATAIENKDAVRAYWMLITARGWCPEMALSAVRAANDITPEDTPDRTATLIVVANRIGLAVAEVQVLLQEEIEHAERERQIEVADAYAAGSPSPPGC